MSFSSDQQYFEQAKKYLLDPAQPDAMAMLRDIIRWADASYYLNSNPFLADAEYDELFAQLKKIEQAHPDLITPDSPTQRVTKAISKQLQNKTHAVPMLSLDNTYNAEDLFAWDKRCRTALPKVHYTYVVEPKYDGASISLTYENGLLTQALTRGDGISGEDVTHNIRLIKSLPLSFTQQSYQLPQIEIRGEVLFYKDAFAALNAQRQEEGLTLLANPRNAASGTLRLLDATEAGKRKLHIILYHIADAPFLHDFAPFQSHAGSLQWLQEAGFPTPAKYVKRFKTIEEVVAYCHQFEADRDALPFEIDGMVIKVDELSAQEQLGMTAHHPRWAVAYKFKARQATSKLLRVEFQIGRTGAIAPVAKIEPVAIGGVMVSSVSLFNEDVIREKDLRIGDTILVERAGDVIPYIVKPFENLRTGQELPIIFPETCPVCHEALEKPVDEAVWRCINLNCEAQVVERIIHFCSKDAMDIRGLGDAMVRKFFDQKILEDIPGIYHLPMEIISTWEGFGKKSVENLEQALTHSKTQPLHRLIFGLGIRHVGETMSKTLAQSISHIQELYTITQEQLLALDDVGPKVAMSVTHFFAHEGNRQLIAKLEASGVNVVNEMRSQQSVSGALSGKTFLFTGTLQQLKRSEAEALVEAAGGKILGSVSSKLNYLVVGDDAGSKLEKAKKLGSVSILSEAEFSKMISTD